MNEWFKNNAISLLIALVTFVSTYTATYVSYGNRIESLEMKNQATEVRLQAVESNGVQTRIDIAKMQKDIEYIRFQLDRIFPPVK